MADLAVLALGLDTGQMKSGGDQASRVLDDLQKRFEALEARSNALKVKLQDSGNAIKGASGHWREFGESARNALGTLSNLGGPIGNVAGKVEQLGGQLGSLVGTFGVVGGAATAFAAAVGAAGAAFVGLSIKGAAAADALLDISEATGLTVDQVQRLGAAMQRSGEDVSGVDRAFKQFQQTVQTAIDDPTSKAATSLRRLGVVATDAGRDTGKAFINTLSQLKELRASTEGAAATNEVFGRGIGALVRSSGELTTILGSTRAELQATGIIASDLALGAAADLDSQMNRLSQSFSTFTIQLNGLGGGVANQVFSDLSDAIEDVNGRLDRLGKNPYWALIQSGVTAIPGIVTPGGGTRTPAMGPRDPRTPDWLGGSVTLRDPIIPEPPKPTGGGRATPTISPVTGIGELEATNRKAKEFFEGSKRVAEVFYSTQITDFQQFTARMTEIDKQFRRDQLLNAEIADEELSKQLVGLKAGGASAESIKRVSDELDKVRSEAIELAEALGIVVLPEIGKFTERLRDFGKLTLPLGPGLNIPSTRPRTVGAPHPDDIPLENRGRPRVVDLETFDRRAQSRERIGAEFGFIFEDFIFQIASARKDVGGAFGDFALGIADVFASELARAFTSSLQRSFITPLAGLLESALDGIFGGAGKGIGKWLGKILGITVGAAVGGGGGFAMGGTIAPNSWGVVGERGAEFAFSGSQPLHIVPQGAMAGGGGIVLHNHFNISAPGGNVDRRSMDQISEQVLRSVERAQRNRGA